MKQLYLLLLGGVLLFIAGNCFAENQWPDAFTAGLGPDAEKEFAALSENGRAAYKRALIACSLYADNYDDANYQDQCKTAYQAFKVEFGGKFIGLFFENVIISTAATKTNIELTFNQGRRPDLNSYGNDFAKGSIAALQKIYREANLHAATVATASPIRPASKIAGQILIPLQQQGGTLVVPVLINKAITLNFIVDSGASDVSIPSDVVSTLVRTGTLQDSDFIGTQTYKLADGSTVPSATFRIRSLTANKVEIGNVKASIAPAAGELLLGQSFLSRFKSWSIDNAQQALVLTQ
jgi:predicted aspartyl protease